MAEDSIAVVILNWNGWKMTIDAVESLRTTVDASWHAYVVDNASTDESRDELRNLGEGVTLIEADRNLGWTGGNNLGLKRALDDGFKYFFIMNNDAFVFPDTLERLQRFYIEDGQDPILGPVHLTGDCTQYDFIGADIKPGTGMPMLREARDFPVGAIAAVSETDYIRGAGIFAGRVHLERIGLFDDRYYLNYDETDWCFRATTLGYKLLMLRDAKIRHLGSATIGGKDSPLNTYFLVRNSLLFAERHCRLRQRVRHLRELYRWYRRMAEGYSIFGAARLLMTDKAGLRAAFRMGLRDYALRRFGDCPTSIRVMNSAY